MRSFLFSSSSRFVFASSILAVSYAAAYNVLLFVCDDLRPDLNAAYGKKEMHTPHFDRFAAESLVFDWAFTNFAICSPSRNSFMSGRAPDQTRVWNFLQDFRHAGVGPTGLPGARWVTLPQHFKEAGYLTLGHGKLYHPGKPAQWDEPQSWSQLQPYGPEHITGCEGIENYCPSQRAPAFFSDYNTTVEAIATLARMREWVKANSTPFFLGVGMHFPHQPWSTDAAYAWEYPPATAGLAPPRVPHSPVDVPGVAMAAELDGNDHLTLNFSNPCLGNSTQDPQLPPGLGLESYPCPSPGNNTVPDFFTQYMRRASERGG